jgi:hypothetical protein
VTAAVPTSPSDLTPGWLTEKLRLAGALRSAEVVDLVSRPCGTGLLGDCYRIIPTYSGEQDGAPATLVGKFAAADAGSRAFARAEALYTREVAFYRELAPRLPVRTPRAYFADVDRNGVDFLLLLEDLAPAEECDQLSGCSVDQAALALEQAAALHGSSWHRPELLTFDWLHSTIAAWHRIGAAFPASQAAFRERYEDQLEPEFLAIGDRLSSELPGWLATLDEPRCLWHCDFRLDNLLFGARGGEIPLAVVDWQAVAAAPGVIDASYFLGAGLPVQQRRSHERALIRHYHQALLAHGVEDYSWESCWREYRLNAIAGLVIGLNASVHVKRTTRGDEMFMTMARRHGAHILDSDSLALISA